jgi:hypothetical protein
VQPLHVMIRHRRPALTPAVAALYRWMTPQQTRRKHDVFACPEQPKPVQPRIAA